MCCLEGAEVVVETGVEVFSENPKGDSGFGVVFTMIDSELAIQVQIDFRFPTQT